MVSKWEQYNIFKYKCEKNKTSNFTKKIKKNQ